MTAALEVTVNGLHPGMRIPDGYCFGILADDGPMALGPNRSPAIQWSAGPEGTRAYTIIMHDPDVPSVTDHVNQEGHTIAADLPRVDFFHWVLTDIASDCTGLPEGADSAGVTIGGKPPGKTDHGVRGFNSYTEFFGGNPDMKGTYAGYDGPCPPWNDARLHRYVYTVFALNVESLGLRGEFSGADALAAMEEHIIGQGSITGTYTLNRDLL